MSAVRSVSTRFRDGMMGVKSAGFPNLTSRLHPIWASDDAGHIHGNNERLMSIAASGLCLSFNAMMRLGDDAFSGRWT